LELRAHRRFRLPGLALGELLPHAQDRSQATLHATDELATDEGIGLALVPAPFGVADDAPRRKTLEHRRGDAARVGARGLGVDVLGTHLDAGPGERSPDSRERDERWADDADDLRIRGRGGDGGGEGACFRWQAVHLPIAGDDDWSHGGIIPVAPRHARGPLGSAAGAGRTVDSRALVGRGL
jgi:hypothetical protein